MDRTQEVVRPRRQEHLLATDLDEEVLLYDSGARQVYVLNATAKVVWELCDGAHSVPQIAAALHREFSVEGDVDVEAQVLAVLADFAGRGILAEHG